jgi:hypothetical protein
VHSHTYRVPPIWDDAALEEQRRRAIETFVTARNAEGGTRYRAAFAENLALVQALFEQTDDLLEFASGSALAADPRLLQPARYISGPPVSADDLDTLAGSRIAGRRRLDADLGRQAAHIIAAAMDRDRFSWLFEVPRRAPAPAERDAAIRWTAGLQTVQQIQTGRRSESARRQEAAVEALLIGLGFEKVGPRSIGGAGHLEPGQFCRESDVVGSKCDIPVCLRDRRFLLLECKVSNSGTNSVKRLNREVGGKARAWRIAFGTRGAVVGVVLSGVYKLQNLKSAQDDGVAIFWEHDLTPLRDFLTGAT